MNNYICTNRSKEYYKEIEKIIQTRKQEILDFFEVNGDYNFNIYIYDTQKELKTGLFDRGFGEFPEYMCACQRDEDNSLNFFEPNDYYTDNEWNKEEYKNIVFHELIHGIQFQIYGSQPEWLTEGIAVMLDGTYSKGIKWLLENYINNTTIPSTEEIIYGFGEHDYDSYDYAYLAVSYLIEIMGKSAFLEAIKDKGKIETISYNIIDEAIEYFNKKYEGLKKM